MIKWAFKRLSGKESEMHSVGVDIIEVSRVKRVLDRWGERFLKRVYSGTELKISRGKTGRLALRFAGKEAVMKALGTGIRGVGWREIEILAEPSGKPFVRLNGKAQEKAAELGLYDFAISLSDSRDYAVAFVVAEKG